MNLVSRFRAWQARLTRSRATRGGEGPLREFVYLDDVSLYSLLASRKNGIAAEFTESETASLNSEVGGSVSAGLGASRAESRARFEAGHSRTTQVLRKAIVQTSSKELRDMERERLSFPLPIGDPPACGSLAQIEQLDTAQHGGWIFDPKDLQRGDLLEIDVSLEADPIFRASTAITTVREIMQENLHLFGGENLEQLAEMRAIGRMLESLLVGLVPVRGRLTSYDTLDVGGKELLVHRELLNQLAPDDRAATYPTFVVGVAERELFWKDIRRVLFAQATYKVFGRLSAAGLADTWRPVKLLDVLGEIHPMFGEEISNLGETALLAMEAAVDASQQPSTDGSTERAVVGSFVTLLAEHHGIAVTDETFEACLRRGMSADKTWIETVATRRAVLSSVQKTFEETFGVLTPADVASNLRITSLLDAGLGLDGSRPSGPVEVPAVSPRRERFLDTEVVAVYW